MMAMVAGERDWTIWMRRNITMMIRKSPQGDTSKDPQDGRNILVDSDKVANMKV